MFSHTDQTTMSGYFSSHRAKTEPKSFHNFGHYCRSMFSFVSYMHRCGHPPWPLGSPIICIFTHLAGLLLDDLLLVPLSCPTCLPDLPPHKQLVPLSPTTGCTYTTETKDCHACTFFLCSSIKILR